MIETFEKRNRVEIPGQMRESRHYPFILDFSDHRNRHSANESIIKYRANISIRVIVDSWQILGPGSTPGTRHKST